MNYLFIDSTYDLTIGLLSEDLKWLDLEHHAGQKASMVIQSRALGLINKTHLKPQELRGIITLNGPGFYTGLRLAEGFSDVFHFFGVKQYSFYSYEIPLWCGFEKGIWFTKAYRGEYFIHKWTDSKWTQYLINAHQINDNVEREQIFIHSLVSLDAASHPLIENPIHSSDLMRKYPEKIFEKVLLSDKKEPFYFRPPEDEFKVNP